jgi:hypothetical protein
VRHHHTKRHSRRNTLRNGNDIGMKMKMLESKHLPGSTHSALYFVHNKKDSALSRDPFKTRQKIRRRHNIPAFTLNRLYDNCRNFIRIHGCFENHIFQVRRIAVRDMSHSGHQRAESFSLYRL